MKALTSRQSEVKAFIRSFVEQNGYSPTSTEIASQFGFAAKSHVDKLLTRLEDRGHLRRSRTMGGIVIARTIKLID